MAASAVGHDFPASAAAVQYVVAVVAAAPATVCLVVLTLFGALIGNPFEDHSSNSSLSN